MRKLLLAFIIFALALVGCSTQSDTPTTEATEPTAEITQPPTVETKPPAEPKPRTTSGRAMVEKAPIVLSVFHRGDKVEVAGALNNGKIVVRIKTDAGYGVMEESMLNIENTEDYTPWQGYPKWNAVVYDNCNLFGEPLRKMGSAQVRVIDEMEYCYVIESDGQIVYVKKSDINHTRSSGGGTGGSGGSSGGGGADGGDISLSASAYFHRLSIIKQEGTVTCTAIVKGDGAEALLGSLEYGEIVPVVSEPGFAPELDNYYTVYINGLYGYVRKELIDLPDSENYEPWAGYSKWGTEVYSSMYLNGEILQKLGTNTEVEVLRELESCYYIRVNDVVGYVSKTLISPTRFSTGGGGGGAGGGGGESWSPPML